MFSKHGIKYEFKHMQWRSKDGRGGGILDKLYVIIFLNYFEQLLLDYIAYLLIVNHLTVLSSA